MGADEQLQQRLRALFAEELDDGLQVLTRGLLELEDRAATAAGRQLVQELFRAAHSLKGAAHAAAVPEAVAACDRLETRFAALRDGDLVADATLVTQLLADTDSLASVAAQLHGRSASAAATDDAEPDARGGGADGTSAAAPSASVPAQQTGSLRVDTEKVDQVLRDAGAGLAASHRLHELVDEARRAGDQVGDARARLRAAAKDRHGTAALEGLGALLDDAARAVGALARSVEAHARALRHTSGDIADAVQHLRTRPFADACSGLDRVVRDVATDSGKSARLRVLGGDAEADRAVITALRDPLLHLVRNAVDHGLEAPPVRAAAGKAAVGTIEVVAELDGSLLLVTVRDDGGGIDADRLREAALRRGIALPNDDLELAFVPGLSSRTDVTAVSGRGVGMDAVRASVEQLGGSVQVVSRAGTGTEVQLTAPVTTAVLRVVLVRAGGEVVALPTSSVERVAHVHAQSLQEVEGQVLLVLDGRSARVVSLAAALGYAQRSFSPGRDGQLGVVIPRGGEAALVTDGLLDEIEVAVQPVPDRLAGAPGVLGVTTISGGLPTLVVNPVALGRSSSSFSPASEPTEAAVPFRILLAEDTVTTRALERSILEAAGYSVAVAVDGADAWEQLQNDGADLVVTDVDMPRMSGIELCRQIRGSAQLRDTPVVLVTSLDSVAHRQRGLEAGADAYVVKAELQQGSLLDTIARLL